MTMKDDNGEPTDDLEAAVKALWAKSDAAEHRA